MPNEPHDFFALVDSLRAPDRRLLSFLLELREIYGVCGLTIARDLGLTQELMQDPGFDNVGFLNQIANQIEAAEHELGLYIVRPKNVPSETLRTMNENFEKLRDMFDNLEPEETEK